MNELDALVNIDFETRTIKPTLTSLNIFRFGTSGSLQKDIPVDSLVAGTFGLGFDNVMHFYRIKNSDIENALIHSFKGHTDLAVGNVIPYIYEGSKDLLNLFTEGYHKGITVGCPGFYGPQGRKLRLALAYEELIDKLSTFNYDEHRIANFEMESSAIYGLGRALGHKCVSLNVIVANRVLQEFSKDSAAAVEKLIATSLNVIANADTV